MLQSKKFKRKGVKTMKRQAGRPEKYNNDFYVQMFKEHENFSISQMAENHNVSNSTIIRWIRKGKVLVNEQKRS